MSLGPRRALLGLLTAVAALAALPAVASASITPALTLDQSAGTTAASSTTVGFNATFSPTSGDSVKDLTFSFPAGLLSDETLDGGACVASPPPASGTPDAGCQIGTSTVTSAIGALPLTLYLVAPPTASDAAGVAAYLGTTQIPPTADVTLGPSGLSTSFTNLPNLGISAVDTTLTGLRMPTSCPSPAASVTLTADSQQDSTPVQTTAPLTVTGCGSLPYAPNLTAAVAADSNGGADLKTVVTQAADEAASHAIAITFPSGVKPNLTAILPCLNGTGCTIGTATATSPLIPTTLNGTLSLGGSVTAPTFTIAFPAPFNLTITGGVDLSSNSVTFANVPDIPLTNLSLDVSGANGQRAFVTDCNAADVTGSFTGQGGQTQTVTAPIAFSGCPASTATGTGPATVTGTTTGTGTAPSSPSGSNQKPKASGSLGGLATGHPKVKLKVADAGGAKVASVAIGLPAGLKFSRSAIVSKQVCATKAHKKKCTTSLRVKGLAVSGGGVKSVALKAGRLVITLKKAAASVTITAAGPLVAESKSLETKVKRHEAGSLRFILKVTTANRASASLTLKLKAH